ncbi:MAG: hypothetical protein KME15_18845 [Drouetiella hepatica Uher 2000/2452]|uniref:Uncharacterized protein n=1 Tax=Drouetiella hepatica Uher 2000/2452 TaxID=904376 RepID=A0A951QFC1_9CYAN|nr:hypothetical protein [Drouetiella hepatica Uher 2000/2452]
MPSSDFPTPAAAAPSPGPANLLLPEPANELLPEPTYEASPIPAYEVPPKAASASEVPVAPLSQQNYAMPKCTLETERRQQRRIQSKPNIGEVLPTP